jgi:predicted metal-dependent hydrolase
MPISRPLRALIDRIREPSEIRKTLRLAGADRQVIFKRNPRATRYTLRVARGGLALAVSMPLRGSLAFAEDFVRRHEGWLEARLRKQIAHVPFLAGSTVPLRGVMHEIVWTGAMRGGVVVGDANGRPVIHVSGLAEHLPRRVMDFLKAEAERDLASSVAKHARVLGVSIARVTIRDTVSRWGSCSSTGALSFSWRVIMAPPFVLDYLAAHEVAHRKEMNHSVRYWRIVAALDPNFREAEKWLKAHGRDLHRYGPEK